MSKNKDIKRWESMAAEFKEVSCDLLNHSDLAMSQFNLFTELIDKDENLSVAVRGAKVTFGQIAIVIQATALEHGANLADITRYMCKTYPELVDVTSGVYNGNSIKLTIIKDANKFTELFDSAVESHKAKINADTVEKYTLLVDGTPYGLEGYSILNPMLPTYVFRTGNINKQDISNLDFAALASRYAVIRHDIATISSTVFLEILPLLGMNPENKELIETLANNTNTLMAMSGINKLAGK